MVTTRTTFAVLLAEQGHRPTGNGIRVRLLLEGELNSLEDSAIHEGFHFGDLVGRERSMMGKVKAQAIRRDQRARLVDMLSEYTPQRRVQQVRGGVIPLGVTAAIARDARASLAELHFTGDLAERGSPPVNLADLVDIDAPAFALYLAAIRDLAARFGVERCLAQHYRYSSVARSRLAMTSVFTSSES